MPINITVELVQKLMEQNAMLTNQVANTTSTIKEITQTIRNTYGDYW